MVDCYVFPTLISRCRRHRRYPYIIIVVVVEFDPLYYSFRFGFPSRSPLFIVVDLQHKTNNGDHPSRPIDRFYRSVSLSCRTVSFFLSLRVVLVLLRPPTPTDDTPTPSLLFVRYFCEQYFTTYE